MNIYWTTRIGATADIFEKEKISLRTYEPTPVATIDPKFYNNGLTNNILGYSKCPAFNDFMKNLFVIRSPIDYNFTLLDEERGGSTSLYGQKEYDRIIFLRSVQDKLLTFNIYNYFIPEGVDSLEMSVFPCFYHSNEFVDNSAIIPGTFDIAKWPRPVELAFHLKQRKININDGEPMLYIKFHTDEKIQFKEFFPTTKFIQLQDCVTNSRLLKTKNKNLQYYYNLLAGKKKFKKLFLDEIKSNVIS